MKLSILKVVLLASTAAFASARLGEDEDKDSRKLQQCEENKNGCTPLFNPCCDGFSCHMDWECYPYPRTENDPCIPTLGQCSDGLVCDITRMKCRATGTSEGDQCNFSRPCSGEGLTCDLRTEKCRLPSEEGETCHPTRPCANGLVCQIGPQTCQLPGEEGSACSVTLPCGVGLTCDLTSQSCRGPSPVGGRCHLTRRCQDGLYCDFDAQVCRAPSGVGGPCGENLECADGLDCDSQTNTCVDTPDPCPLEGCDDGETDIDDEEPEGQPCALTDPDCSINTEGPVENPVTPAPVTLAPVTPAPVTPAPVTPAPVTSAPVTTAPVTPAPVTSAPSSAPTEGPIICPLTGCEGDNPGPPRVRKIPSPGYAQRPKISNGRGGFGNVERMDGRRRRHLVKGSANAPNEV